MSLPLKYDLNLSVDFISKEMHNRPGDNIDLGYITIHNTDNDNPGADAGAHSRFVRNKGFNVYKGRKVWVSWHFTVDDTEVIKQLPTNEVGYHAKTGNTKSIGIEQCMHKGINSDDADERLCQLVAQLRLKKGLGRESVVTHKHWTQKNCPSQLLSRWTEIQERIDEIIATSPAVQIDLVDDIPKGGFESTEISSERRKILEANEIMGGFDLKLP